MQRTNAMLAVLLISLTLQARGQTGDNTYKTSVPDSRDISKAFDLVLAVQAGSGMNVSQRHLPNAYLGIKIGGPIAEKSGPPRFFHAFILDLGYDRSHERNGASAEFSAMLPILRFPDPHGHSARYYLRIYGEPGVGYRGDGGSTAYASAKVMIALLSDKRIETFSAFPFIELQRRLPFTSPLSGDTRISIGIMTALCNHCGLN